MKTFRFISILLAAVAVLTSCNEDVVIDNPVVVNTTPDDELVVEIDGDNSQRARTRVAYSGWATSFETGDKIGIYCWNGTSVVASNVPFTKQSNGTWTTATNTRVPYNASYTYFCYFPYNASHGYTPGTSGNADTRFATFIADASNRFWKADQSTKANYDASNLMIAQGTHVGSGNKVNFAMDHKRGLAVFTGEAAEATFTGNVPYLISDTKYFLMKPSTSTSFSDDEGTYSLSAASGKYVSHSVSLAIDLSMVDNAGNPRVSMTTANCYLIHKSGKYKLPLVYGNAIKNGTANTVAYAPGGSTTTTYCANFTNHAGTAISGPWITKSTSGTGVNKGMGITVNMADLLWQDKSDLITSVSVNGDYLEFTVGSFGSGNALIAVRDVSYNILWSWHIWATTETLASTTTVATGSHNYAVAPVNLGWVPTSSDGKQGYCPYYQWGRKDPFIPASAYNSTTNHTVYNIKGKSVTSIIFSTSAVGIDGNIKQPTTHFNVSNVPVTTKYYNIWDAQNTTTKNVTTATKKTIYDPCPPGFCVPTGNLWYYFGGNENPTGTNSRSDSNWDSTNNGKTWTLNGVSIYFPAAGYRRNNSGALEQVGSTGYYWSATPFSYNNGSLLKLNSSSWNWNNNYRAYGYSVRPVAEE